jgi:hypothetical protein
VCIKLYPNQPKTEVDIEKWKLRAYWIQDIIVGFSKHGEWMGDSSQYKI